MDKLEIFIDGSCADNGRPNAIGGWAFVVTAPSSEDILEKRLGKLRVGKQTNNRAELEATYQALKWIYIRQEKTQYTIYCDSEVVVNGVNGSSARNANRDIWEGIESLCQMLIKEGKLTQDSFKNIEAHMIESDDVHHKMNCIADKLAKQGANSLLLKPEIIRKENF